MKLESGIKTAESIMTRNPVSLNEDLPLREAARVLAERGFSGMPVVNEAGRPVGVLTRADIVRYEAARRADAPEPAVRAIMTPTVHAMPADARPIRVVREMLNRGVHRMFIVDRGGVLIGVVSAIDVLRHLEE